MSRHFSRNVFPSVQRACTSCRNRSFVITNHRGMNLPDFLGEARVDFCGKLNKILERGPAKVMVEFLGSFKDDTKQAAGNVFHAMPSTVVGTSSDINVLFTRIVEILNWKTGNGALFPLTMVTGVYHFQVIVYVDDSERF